MNEEAAYEQVAAELLEGHLKPGLWTKAIADSAGNEALAKSLYIKSRAVQLMAEFQAEQARAAGVLRAEQLRLVRERTCATAKRATGTIGKLLLALIGLGSVLLGIAAVASLIQSPKGADAGTAVIAAFFVVLALVCFKKLLNRLG